jgi:hypothetical protein
VKRIWARLGVWAGSRKANAVQWPIRVVLHLTGDIREEAIVGVWLHEVSAWSAAEIPAQLRTELVKRYSSAS